MTEHAKDECNQGHLLRGANVRLIRNPNGTTSRRCLICERASVRAYQLRQRQKRGLPPPRPYRRRTSEPTQSKPPRVRPTKQQCKHGHPLSGSNVKLITNSDGTTKRRCVECERAAGREYQRRLRAKKPPAPPVRTFAQKLTDYTQADGECHIWNGKLDKGHPTLFDKGKYTRVRKALYEHRYGAIKHPGDTEVTCGHELCVREAHIEGVQRELQAQAQRAAQAARAQIGSRVMQCYDGALRYARYRAGDLDAEDIAMTAVTATYDRLQQGIEIDDIAAFLRTAVKNAIVDRIRHIQLVPIFQLTDAHNDIASPLDTSDPLLICERSEYQQKQYARTMQRVRYRSKQAARVLRLKIKGLSAEQIGDKLGIAVHTVERHMTTARRIALPPQQMERSPHEPIAAVLR